MTNELFSSTGYRMDFFQMYNWGVFDKAIYTVDCKGKSTLLTGENGSGKTSLVDAIMTLLVPQNMRYYNQSSGSNRKHDRNEESYVLGAYGTRQEDNSEYAKTQTLRDNSTYSILTACFTDTSLQSSVSLLQVRYFTGETLQRVFALSRTKVSIQDIKDSLSKRNLSIDRTANWKRVLSEDFGTIFFQDNFKKYCDTYSAIFGFRSDKALRLFTQIVGLKVLGNLTDFIRANMLEEHDIISRFDQLKENYTNLMQSNNEILKAKAQIELLEPIKESGENYRKLFAEKEKLEQLKQCSPIWFTSQARAILSDDLENIRDTLQINIDSKKKEEETQQAIQEEIDGIKLSIAQNAVTLRLKSIKDKMESLEKEKKFVDDTKSSYIEKLDKVGIELPSNAKAFNDTKKTIENAIESENQKKDKLDKQRLAFYANDTGTDSKIDSIKNELASLGKRKSNIPLENIDIRASICRALSYEESEIPFAGELLMVKESESKWENSIEKLLHNFALTLLVKPEIYEEVTDYIKNTNMNGRVVYIKTEDELVLADDDSTDENTVPGKIKVREEHELALWLKSYIQAHFNYLCTDDTKELGKTSHAITSSGLIKKGLKHEKDDRKHIANASHVLGWNNSYKRQKLSSDLDDLKKANEERLIKEKEIINEITSIDEKIRTLKNLEDIKDWSFIDTESYIKQLDDLQHEHDEILNSDMSIKELHKKLEIKTEEYKKITNRINTLTGIIAILQDKQKQKEYNLGKYNSTWELLKGNADDEENDIQKEVFSAFEKEYEKYLQAKSIDELEKFSALINDDIETRMEACDKKSNEIAQDFVKKMSIIKNPSQKLRESYGDWSSDFLDMDASPEYLDEYIAVYNRLKKDDLPQYISQFQQYLHETMNDNI
nr:hypothetical protein [Treponema sp.]